MNRVLALLLIAVTMGAGVAFAVPSEFEPEVPKPECRGSTLTVAVKTDSGELVRTYEAQPGEHVTVAVYQRVSLITTLGE